MGLSDCDLRLWIICTSASEVVLINSNTMDSSKSRYFCRLGMCVHAVLLVVQHREK